MGSFLDRFFESANQVLDSIDETLPPTETAPQEQDDYHKAWEESWKKGETGWAMCRKVSDSGGEVMDGYHAFQSKQPAVDVRQAVCSAKFKPEHVGKVEVLDHNRRLTVCTSCIIGVSK